MNVLNVDEYSKEDTMTTIVVNILRIPEKPAEVPQNISKKNSTGDLFE